MSNFSWKLGSASYISARLRTYETPAGADSCMTSPSEPVRVRVPLPFRRLVSIDRTSPPPPAPPCPAGFRRHSIAADAELPPSEEIAQILRRNPDGPPRLLLDDPPGNLPAH